MKSYISIPRYFLQPESIEYQEFKPFYDKLISSLIKRQCDVVLSQFQAVINNRLTIDVDDGIAYAYHSRSPGRNTFCVKGGALPGLWYVDRDGYSGWSQIANDPELQRAGLTFDIAQAERVIAFYRKKFFEDNFSKYPQKNDSLGGMVAALGQYVFYPLQMNADEVMNLSLFSQVDVIRRLSALAGQTGVDLVLKRHPKCTSPHIQEEILSAARSDRVHVSDGSVHQLIDGSRAVVVANSGVGQEALIHGKPVYSFARSEYAHMTTAVRTMDDLALAFGEQCAAQPEPVTRQLGHLLCDYFVDGHDPESVDRRVKANLAEFREQAGDDQDRITLESRLSGRASVLHAIDLMLYDSVDYMLSVFAQVPEEARDRMSILLARAAHRGPQRERILRDADERTIERYVGQCLREGNLDEAVTRARRSVERFASSQSFLLLAKALLKKGDRAEGVRFAEKAAQAPDASAEALFLLGRERIGVNPDEARLALDYARKAIAVDPDHALAHWLKARAHVLLAEPEPALAAANRAIELAPAHEGLKKIREVIFEKFGDPDAAPCSSDVVRSHLDPSTDPAPEDQFRDYDLAFEEWREKNPGAQFSDFSLRRVAGALRRGVAHDTLGPVLTRGQNWNDAGRGAFEKILARRPLAPSARVCDYGCGSLRVTSHFIRRQDSGCVYGLDRVADFIRLGRGLMEPETLTSKRPRFGVIPGSIPKAEAFGADLVYATSVARHVHPDEKQDFLTNLLRLARKPGAALIFDAHIGPQVSRFARSGWAWPLEYYVERLAPLSFVDSWTDGAGFTHYGFDRRFLLFVAS